jgi:hypothetical protein
MGVLLLLMTIGGLILAFFMVIASYIFKKAWLRKLAIGGMIAWFIFYIAALFGFSLISKEKLLALKEEKAFCGFYFDCHLHASISEVSRRPNDDDRDADTYTVKLKISNDARRAALRMPDPIVKVIDENGIEYYPVEDITISNLPFSTEIAAGGSAEEIYKFAISKYAKNLKLDVQERADIDRLIEKILIDDEDSIFHKRSFFKIETNDLKASFE